MSSSRRAVPLMELLEDASLQAVDIMGNPRTMITGISTHAQRTGRNEMFVAINGTCVDSHMMLSEAVDAGASVLVVEKETRPYPGVTVVRVPNTRFVLGPLAQAFHGNPTRAMNVCGITGTNGKTTSTHLVRSILQQAGCKTGLVGTLGAYFGGKFINLNTTTPGPLELAEILGAMEQENIDSVVMECSSHAIDQGRIHGIPFRVGALVGVTQDHLDYHGDFESYAECKRRLFYDYVGTTPGSVSCFNLDDAVGEHLSRTYLADHIGFSKNPETNCQIKAESIQLSANGTSFVLSIEGKKQLVQSCLIGAFNVTNMLTAASCAHSLGADLRTISEGLRNAPQVAGRFEFIQEGQPFSVVVDYAHTPDALERVLRTARRLCLNRLIVVFGCGGDRDRSKRPLMGKVAGDHSDFAIVTSDNPRMEEPSQIARGVLQGILQSSLKSNRYHVILERRQAVEQALHMASPGDVVVIAGKGHEDYQDIGVKRVPFDDRAVVRTALKEVIGNYSQAEIMETPTEKIT